MKLVDANTNYTVLKKPDNTLLYNVTNETCKTQAQIFIISVFFTKPLLDNYYSYVHTFNVRRMQEGRVYSYTIRGNDDLSSFRYVLSTSSVVWVVIRFQRSFLF
jgi:hypothetical protein